MNLKKLINLKKIKDSKVSIEELQKGRDRLLEKNVNLEEQSNLKIDEIKSKLKESEENRTQFEAKLKESEENQRQLEGKLNK